VAVLYAAGDVAAAAAEQAARAPVVDGRLRHPEQPGSLVDREHGGIPAGPVRVGERRGDLGLDQLHVAVLTSHRNPAVPWVALPLGMIVSASIAES
jgi:hypothetical protein